MPAIRRITQTTNLGENLAKAADLFNFPLSEEAQMALERTAQALDIYRKARKEVTVLQNTKRREQRAQIDRDAEAIERALMEGFNPQLAPDKVSKLEADIIREERRVEAAGRVVVRMARAIREQFEDEPEWWDMSSLTAGPHEMAFDLEADDVTNAEKQVPMRSQACGHGGGSGGPCSCLSGCGTTAHVGLTERRPGHPAGCGQGHASGASNH